MNHACEHAARTPARQSPLTRLARQPQNKPPLYFQALAPAKVSRFWKLSKSTTDNVKSIFHLLLSKRHLLNAPWHLLDGFCHLPMAF
jgi:hypothetical protein